MVPRLSAQFYKHLRRPYSNIPDLILGISGKEEALWISFNTPSMRRGEFEGVYDLVQYGKIEGGRSYKWRGILRYLPRHLFH